jgi:hypothetical protein
MEINDNSTCWAREVLDILVIQAASTPVFPEIAGITAVAVEGDE